MEGERRGAGSGGSILYRGVLRDTALRVGAALLAVCAWEHSTFVFSAGSG